MALIFENPLSVKEKQSRVVLQKNKFVQKGVQTTINACVGDCPVEDNVLCNFFWVIKKASKNGGLKEKFNRNILYCKFHCACCKINSACEFNRNILYCKFGKLSKNSSFGVEFNRNILYCKFFSFLSSLSTPIEFNRNILYCK